MPSQSLLDRVGLLIDLDAAIRADAAREGVPVKALQKADQDRPVRVQEAVWAN
jgi:hypothetical protein